MYLTLPFFFLGACSLHQMFHQIHECEHIAISLSICNAVTNFARHPAFEQVRCPG